jgi:hypothetical protein
MGFHSCPMVCPSHSSCPCHMFHPVASFQAQMPLSPASTARFLQPCSMLPGCPFLWLQVPGGRPAILAASGRAPEPCTRVSVPACLYSMVPCRFLSLMLDPRQMQACSVSVWSVLPACTGSSGSGAWPQEHFPPACPLGLSSSATGAQQTYRV